MTLIAAAFMLLCALVGAKLEGEADGARSLTGKPVEHKFSALWRVVIGVAIAVLVTALAGAPWWTVFPLLGIAFGGFNILFRLTLNKRRKLDWRYISNSNEYDWFWLKLCGMNRGYYGFSYRNVPAQRDIVHRAGTLAYAFEFAVLLASTILLILTNA